MDTSVINKIALCAHDESGAIAMAALPYLGENIDWTGEVASWTLLGSVQGGDDIDLDSESVDVTPNREIAKLKAPRSLTHEEIAILSNGIDEITFTVYGTKADVLGIDSTMDATGAPTYKRGSSLTYQSMIVEVAGKGAFYYPKVVVMVNPTGGSVSEAVKAEVTVVVMGYTGIESGEQWHDYVARA